MTNKYRKRRSTRRECSVLAGFVAGLTLRLSLLLASQKKGAAESAMLSHHGGFPSSPNTFPERLTTRLKETRYEQ